MTLPTTRAELDALAAHVPTAARLSVDPLGFVPADGTPDVQEVAAFMAAGLALGHVKAIGRSVARVIAHLDEPEKLGFQGHRWIRGPDIAAVVGRLVHLQREYGSLGQAFAVGYAPGQMKDAMTAFTRQIRHGLPDTRGVKSLTAAPADGSACKRLNLFLRWMVRSGPTDLGLWPHVSTGDLFMPLDVHVIRFARAQGITTRVSVNWRMVEEVTDWFRERSPDDPLRWDFVISHLGMMGE